VVHTLDLDIACSMSRVFHRVSSEMKLFTVFALFKHEGILFQSSTNLLEKKCLLSSSLAGWTHRFNGSAVLLVSLPVLFTEEKNNVPLEINQLNSESTSRNNLPFIRKNTTLR
jgi:hypothetical protein